MIEDKFPQLHQTCTSLGIMPQPGSQSSSTDPECRRMDDQQSHMPQSEHAVIWDAMEASQREYWRNHETFAGSLAMFNGSVPLWHIPPWRTGWRPSKNQRRALPKAKDFEPELNLPKVMKAAWRKRRKPLYVVHSYSVHSEEGKQEYTHPSGTMYIYIHIPQNLRLYLYFCRVTISVSLISTLPQ